MFTTVNQTMGMKTNHSSMSIKIVPKGRDSTEDSLLKQKVIICLTVLTMDKFKNIKEYSNVIALYKPSFLLKYWIKFINHKGKTVTNYILCISSQIMLKGVTNIKRLTFLLHHDSVKSYVL